MDVSISLLASKSGKGSCFFCSDSLPPLCFSWGPESFALAPLIDGCQLLRAGNGMRVCISYRLSASHAQRAPGSGRVGAQSTACSSNTPGKRTAPWPGGAVGLVGLAVHKSGITRTATAYGRGIKLRQEGKGALTGPLDPGVRAVSASLPGLQGPRHRAHRSASLCQARCTGAAGQERVTCIWQQQP